jgi:hypothetical protein
MKTEHTKKMIKEILSFKKADYSLLFKTETELIVFPISKKSLEYLLINNDCDGVKYTKYDNVKPHIVIKLL